MTRAQEPQTRNGSGPGVRWLVAGLGNPGEKYQNTRHNAGFLVIDRLAESYGIDLLQPGPDPQVLWAKGTVGAVPVVLAKPLAYMNRSGPPVRRLADELHIPVEAVMVVHDDVDLAFGRIKIKEKGGDGGHRGVMSLMEAFGRDDFVRLRIGIGRPAANRSVTDHVLSGFSPEEEALLDPVLDRACQAAAAAIRFGAAAAMNRFNTKEAHTHQVNS